MKVYTSVLCNQRYFTSHIYSYNSVLNDTYIFHRCENVPERIGCITHTYKGHAYAFELIYSLRAAKLIRLIVSAVTIVYIYL